MNKTKAMIEMKELMGKNKYIYKFTDHLSIDSWHYTFDMGPGLPETQMSLTFLDYFLDVLAFPHPVIVNEDNFINLLQAINYINNNVKGLGHFYIDEYHNIAYCLRLKYDLIEGMPAECLREIELAVDIYVDILKILFDVSRNVLAYEQCRAEIDLIWQRG